MPMPALDGDTVVPIEDAMRKVARKIDGAWATDLDAIEVAGYLATLDKSLKQGLSLDQSFELWAVQHFIGEMLKQDSMPTRKGALDWDRLQRNVSQCIHLLKAKYDAARV